MMRHILAFLAFTMLFFYREFVFVVHDIDHFLNPYLVFIFCLLFLPILIGHAVFCVYQTCDSVTENKKL